MSNSVGRAKNNVVAATTETEDDRYRKKLHRILRSSEMETPHLSGGVSPFEPRRMSDRMKEATLSPAIVNPASVVQEEEPLFQCTDCDMIVKGSDPYCPFCGAIFSDGPLAGDADPDELVERPPLETPAHREPMIRPEKFDIFSLIRTKSRSREMLYQEASKGFAGSARLLEEVEHLVSDVGALGTDTSKARRLIGSAWEACRDGNWNLVSALAHQTEELVEPSIPDLVKSEISKARALLSQAKEAGVDISRYVMCVKNAMQSLRANDPDEALRMTKELMDSLREDSVTWKRVSASQ